MRRRAMTELSSVREAARALGVHRCSLYRNIREGIVPNRGTAERPLVAIDEALAAGVRPRRLRRRFPGAGDEPLPAQQPQDDTAPELGISPPPPLSNEIASDPMPDIAQFVGELDLAGVNEAGRRLGIHGSNISHHLKNGLIPNRGTAERPLVDMAELRQARAAGLDRSKQMGPAAQRLRAAADPAAVVPLFPDEDQGSPAGASSPAPPAGPETYHSARARREVASAARAEVELARLLGETLDRAEVHDFAFGLGQRLREAMDARRDALVQRLTGLDTGAMTAALAAADDADLIAFADTLEREFGAPVPNGSREPAAEPLARQIDCNGR
jgi:hypothetical protein